MLKAVVLVVLAGLLCGAVIVFEASSKTAFALDLVAASQVGQSDDVRAQLLDQGEHALTDSWAEPLRWHAGAAEALSAIYLLKAQTSRDARLYDQSVVWAVKAVQLAAVQPHALTRLAQLAEQGYRNPLCSLEQCLNRSWLVGPLSDPETDCLRIQIAHRNNLLRDGDPRVDAYVRSGVTREEAATCLSFLPPMFLFRALMLRAEADP